MPFHFRKIAAPITSLLFLIPAAIPAQTQTTGTKKDVEQRLKAAEKPKPITPLDNFTKTLNATRRFEQTAISLDGTKVAWTETLTNKDGAPSGNTAIYIK